MTVLSCPAFEHNNVFKKEDMIKFRVAGAEALKEDLIEHAGWTGTKGATAILHLNDTGEVVQAQPLLLGTQDAKYVDASLFWARQAEGAHVKIGPVDLNLFTFSGSMISSWVSPENFPWSYRIPSKSKPDKHHVIEKNKLKDHHASPLWIRAMIQPIPGPKFKVSLCAVPAENIVDLAGHATASFPIIEVGNTHLPLIPADGDRETDLKLGLGFIPYFLDVRQVEGEDLEMPSSWSVKSAICGLTKTAMQPNQKKTFKNWSAAIAAAQWEDRPSAHTFPDPRSEAPEEEEEEDDVGPADLSYEGALGNKNNIIAGISGTKLVLRS